MEITLFIFLALFIGCPALLVMFDFLSFLLVGERFFVRGRHILESIIIAVPVFLLYGQLDSKNNCCGETALFSPQHRLSLYTLIGLCMICYFYSSYRKKMAPPVVEVLVNCLLLAGIVLNVFVALQFDAWYGYLAGTIPVVILFVFSLVRNHRLVMDSMGEPVFPDANGVTRLCRYILCLKPIAKIPVLLILCLPVLVLLTSILLLFGQRPDSLVRVFTDTYHQGLSQLNDECNGVVCGGHFLCTIAAKGHSALVRPVRAGIRGGRPIKCNRQLLISNAFEELIEQRVPAIHRPVRILYNWIGDRIHRNYGLFDHKWVSDLVYILMKPLEWFFLMVLYVFTRNPENRIAWQYLGSTERQTIDRHLSKPAGDRFVAAPKNPRP